MFGSRKLSMMEQSKIKIKKPTENTVGNFYYNSFFSLISNSSILISLFVLGLLT